MSNCTFCFVCLGLQRMKWLVGKNSLWNGMWCSTEVCQSQWLFCQVVLAAARLPARQPACLLHLHRRLLHSLFHVHLITSIFLWLSFLWIRSHWEFAALNYAVVIKLAWASTLWCLKLIRTNEADTLPEALASSALLRFSGVALQKKGPGCSSPVWEESFLWDSII